MPPQSKVTPALYGIVEDGLSMSFIKKNWDELVVPILRNETKIYGWVFEAFAITEMKEANKAIGKKFFLTFLDYYDFKFECKLPPDASSKELILTSVFDIYWLLAKEKTYWNPNCYAEFGQHIMFEQVLEVWTKNHVDYINWCEDRLN